MLIPKKQDGKNKGTKPKWLNADKIKKHAKRSTSVSEKAKALIKPQTKEIVFSYMCSQCKKSFRAENLRKQLIEAAKRADTHISCPKCGRVLVADRKIKVPAKLGSKINRNADLFSVYQSQGIVPGYVPQTWVDRAILEKVAHELGKFAKSVGMFNPQLKFQGGIRGKVREGSPENVKFAEYTIESTDSNDIRFRVLAIAGITPAGKVLLPKTFKTLAGKEISFTEAGVQEFVSGKVFEPADPTFVVPKLYYKDPDPVRFREIVASQKKKAARIFSGLIDDYRFVWHYTWGEEYLIEGGDPDNYPDDYIQPGIIGLQKGDSDEYIATVQLDLEDYYKLTNNGELNIEDDTEAVENNLTQYFKDFIARGDLEKVLEGKKASKKKAQTSYYQDKIEAAWNDLGELEHLKDDIQTDYDAEMLKVKRQRGDERYARDLLSDLESAKDRIKELEGKIASKTAAGVPTPGQTVMYQEKEYTVDSVTGDASVLVDVETGVQTAPIPNADLNIQIEEGVVAPTAPMAKEKIEKLVKKSLRDEKTLVPFTDPKPDYSIAEQSKVDPDFGVPYEESDQGILEEEDKAVQRMFRGGTSIKPTKSAAEIRWQRVIDDLHSDIDNAGGVSEFLDLRGSDMIENAVVDWVSEHDLILSSEEFADLNVIVKNKKADEDAERIASIKKTAPEKAELERMVRKCMKDKGWGRGKCENYIAGGIWGRKGKKASLHPGMYGVTNDGYKFTVLEVSGNDIEIWEEETNKSRWVNKYEWETAKEPEYYSEGRKTAKEGIPPYIYNILMEEVRKGKSFEEVAKIIEDTQPGFDFRREDYDEAKESVEKEASIKKKAEPTGYHETDETGKVIELSRLRKLVEDYARAGQFPPDFDLTKVMSEVSRMTRKELLEILDKKLKDTHYPVVHAKKKIAFETGLTPEEDLEFGLLQERIIGKGETLTEKESETYLKLKRKKEKFREKKPTTSKKQTIKGKSTNDIIRKIRKADLTEKDIKEDIKDEKEGAETYKEQAKEVESEKAKKVLEEAAKDEAEHAEKLEEVVLPAVEKVENYLKVYDSRRKKKKIAVKKSVDAAGDLVVWRKDEYVRTVGTDPGVGGLAKIDEVDEVSGEFEEPVQNIWVEYIAGPNKGESDYWWSFRLEKVDRKEVAKILEEERTASTKTAQEEKEKPVTEYKELKTKPHKPELEVEEAIVATPEMQKVFNEIKGHQQRLDEIKAIITDARAKVENQIRKIREEQGSIEEESRMKEGIEKLAALLDESEKRIVDLGEFFVYLDTSMKTKKFKPSDKWRVQKLLEKFGKEAEEYLDRAEKGSASLNEEVQQRLLTVFPKREGSIEKTADIIDVIADLGSNLWEYVKSLAEILEEGEQLEFVL